MIFSKKETAENNPEIGMKMMARALKIIKRTSGSEEAFQQKVEEMLNTVCASQGEEHRDYFRGILNNEISKLDGKNPTEVNT